MSLMKMTAVELGSRIKSKEISAVEAARAALDQIKSVEDKVNSYVTVLDEDVVLERAARVQQEIEAGKLTGPLRVFLQPAVLRYLVILSRAFHQKLCLILKKPVQLY